MAQAKGCVLAAFLSIKNFAKVQKCVSLRSFCSQARLAVLVYFFDALPGLWFVIELA